MASSAFLRYVNSAYFSDMPIFDLSLISLVSGTLVGFLTVTLAALSPANKAAKVSPQCAVSGNAEKNAMFTTKAALNIKRIKPETSLGISHALSDKKNILLMTGSFAISIILFLSFSVMVDFMGQGIRALKPYTPDISIVSSDNSNSLDKEVLEQAQNISSVKRAFGRMFEGDLSITSDHGIAKINLISYEENQFKWAKQELVSGNIDTVINENNAVLVVHSDNSNLQVGDTFTIKTAHGENTVYVAGVLSNSSFVSEAGIQTVICSEQTFQDLTGKQGYSVIDMQLARNASGDTVTQLRGLTSLEQTFSDRREVNTGAKAAYYCAEVGSESGNTGSETALQRHRQLIQLHRHRGEQPHSHKAFDGIESSILDAASAGLRLNPAFKGGHHKADTVERPCQIGKEQHNGLYPAHFEQVSSHVSHLHKKVAEESHDLTVDPIYNLTEDSVSDKIPYKHLNFTSFIASAPSPALAVFSLIYDLTIRLFRALIPHNGGRRNNFKGGICVADYHL